MTAMLRAQERKQRKLTGVTRTTMRRAGSGVVNCTIPWTHHNVSSVIIHASSNTAAEPAYQEVLQCRALALAHLHNRTCLSAAQHSLLLPPPPPPPRPATHTHTDVSKPTAHQEPTTGLFSCSGDESMLPAQLQRGRGDFHYFLLDLRIARAV